MFAYFYAKNQSHSIELSSKCKTEPTKRVSNILQVKSLHA